MSPSTTQPVSSVKVRAPYEIGVLVLSVFLLIAASMLLDPLRMNPLLFNGASQGGATTSDMSQYGWPLPFGSSYTEDTGPKSVKSGEYDIPAGIIDLALIYIVTRLIAIGLSRKRNRA